MAEAAESLVFNEADYLAVPLASLIHRKASLSDLFIRLPSERMVMVAHKGSPIDIERIHRLGNKDVQHLYVHKSDFSGIVSDLVRSAEILKSVEKFPEDMKIAKYFSIAESVYVELLKLPISDESLGRAVRLSQEIGTSMVEKPDFTKLIKSVVGMGDEFTKHSVGTVVMSNLLATQLGWKSPKLIQPITMGAFFHDVGLKEIPRELWFKNRLEMTKDETQVWETHPAIGMQMLSQINLFTPDALRIVAEHHELPNGTGFPSKLRMDRIFPMSRAVSLGNMLAHDIFEPTPGVPFSIDLMLQKIDHVYSIMFGPDLAKAARKIFRKDEKER